MITVDQQTWTTLAALSTFALGLFVYLATMKRDLRADVKSDVASLKVEIAGVDGKLDATRIELKDDIAGLRTELKGEIAQTRTELKDEIAQTRSELKTELRKVEGRLISLEDRTYDISTRLPAAPADSPTT